jgi:hypothetical protein
VQSALREMPESTRLVLVEMLSTTLEMLGTSNGLKTEKAIAIAAKRLTDEFGHFTIEDWRLCLYEMEAGRSVKHYNNTNLEWLINCFQAYDERKLEVMRQLHSEQATAHQRETATLFQVPLTDAIGDRERAPRSLAKFISGAEGRMTFDERDEMARRDVARRDAKVKQQMRQLVRAQMRAERRKS